MNGKTHRIERLTPWHFAAAAALACLGVAVTFDAWTEIFKFAWKDEEYSHIFLVPVVALWMVWVRKVRLNFCRPTGTILGPVLVALGWAAGSYGFHHANQALWHGGAVIVVVGCVIAVLGKHVLFRFFPAFLVLIFLVPVPGKLRQAIALPLQSWTASAAQTSLELVGIETELSGSVLSINGRPVTIVEACNGMRMVFPLVLVSFAFGFGLPLRQSVRMLIILASPLVGIFCNVLRIMPTIWLYGNQPSIAETFHNYSGWLMPVLAFLLLLGIIRLMRWAMLPVTRFPLASQYA